MSEGNIKAVKSKLAEINKTISALDPSIRLAAFNILAPYYFRDYEPGQEEKDTEPKTKPRRHASADDIEKFFATHEHKKPADNVLLIAAWIYSQNGLVSITAALCSEISTKTGVTIPGRPDNTMRFAKRKAKSLFRQVGKGWQLTTQGEVFVKETYGVRKGNKKAEDAEE